MNALKAFTLRYHLLLIALLAAALVAGGAWALHEHDNHVRDADRAQALVAGFAKREQDLRAQLSHAQVRVAVESVTVVQHATKYQTLRDTLRLADTVEVKTALAQADTTIRSCTAFLTTCAQRAEISDSIASTLTHENAVLLGEVKRLQPSGFASFLHKALPIAAFVGGVYVGAKVTR